MVTMTTQQQSYASSAEWHVGSYMGPPERIAAHVAGRL